MHNVPFSVRLIKGDKVGYNDFLNQIASITATDDRDQNVTLTIAGDTVDINRKGSYVVEIEAIDSSGNRTYDEILVNVR
ncbi:hypothetical protein DLH72_03940 [Candidatus Gracilibacteria bacterium]|nr:MAG: hypothetical protein DLH72_03940 [Candidatus Gracilibacteria bacterium]